MKNSKFVIPTLILLLSTEVTYMGIKHSGTKADTETLYAAEWNADHVNTGTDGIFFKWKDASENAMTSLNKNANQAFTDLDLTAYTSANAKAVVLRFRIVVHTAAHAYGIVVRKNGTTPSHPPTLVTSWACTGPDEWQSEVTVGMDTGQVIEYELDVSAGGEADFAIDVLGFWE
jgi:hypothetical protein